MQPSPSMAPDLAESGEGELGFYLVSTAAAATLALLNGLAVLALAFGPVLFAPRLISLLAGAGFLAGFGLALLGLAAALRLALYHSGMAEFRQRRQILLAGAQGFPSLFGTKEAEEAGRLFLEEMRLWRLLFAQRLQIRLMVIASGVAFAAALLIACLGLA